MKNIFKSLIKILLFNPMFYCKFIILTNNFNTCDELALCTGIKFIRSFFITTSKYYDNKRLILCSGITFNHTCNLVRNLMQSIHMIYLSLKMPSYQIHHFLFFNFLQSINFTKNNCVKNFEFLKILLKTTLDSPTTLVKLI